MPPSARPRGPLPARVYWVRRAVVLGVPLVLVVVLARVLGGSADGKDTEQATQAAATTAPAAESSPAVAGPTAPAAAEGRKGRKRKKGKPAPPPKPVLAEPSGPCANDDIVITPAVTALPGGSDVPITLNVRTQETEACTWTASPETMTVTITSGSDHIWSSRECPAAIAVTDLVVRRVVDAPVTLTWNARRSEEGCTSPSSEWAKLGWYHIEAAAMAGEPTDVQFELVAPSAPVVTKTVDPKPGNGAKGKKNRGERHEHRAGDDGGGNSDG